MEEGQHYKDGKEETGRNLWFRWELDPQHTCQSRDTRVRASHLCPLGGPVGRDTPRAVSTPAFQDKSP